MNKTDIVAILMERFLNVKKSDWYFVEQRGKISSFEIEYRIKDADGDYLSFRLNLIQYIFSHEFAKAFWGKDKYVGFDESRGAMTDYNSITKEEKLILFTLDEIKNNGDEKLINRLDTYRSYQPLWQYHLQQMVLEENPLKYLEKFL
jgi:hypothetical protein